MGQNYKKKKSIFRGEQLIFKGPPYKNIEF